MSKVEWRILWGFYRYHLNLSNSIARTLIKLETWYDFPQDHVAQLAKVVLAADDSFTQE